MTHGPASLQGRLLVLVLGVLLVVWLATATMTWLDARHELDELLDAHLAQAAALLVAQQLHEPGGEHDGNTDDTVIDAPSLHRYAPKAVFQVFHEGRLVLRSANAPATPMVARELHFSSGFQSVQLAGVAWRVFATRGAERDVQVYVGEQVASRAAILRGVLRSTLWPMAVALPLLALAVWWGGRSALQPLHRLGALLAARQSQALHPVALDPAPPTEMRPLVHELNRLFERIGELLEAERRFTADAAHELRTPIAAIRAQAQVALGETDEQQRRHALQATLQGCDRAARLVEQLLMLARLDAQGSVARDSVDLAVLARRVAAELAPCAQARQQHLEVDAAGPCLLQGDETLLAVLLRNLLDNALRYSQRGACARVSLGSDSSGAWLCVEDSGPGLAPADAARLGERFVRMAGSGESGSGLGWSIARRIAQVHGLALWAEPSARLGGLAVWLRPQR
jgi:two-component system sensor histidine kinase QseC